MPHSIAVSRRLACLRGRLGSLAFLAFFPGLPGYAAEASRNEANPGNTQISRTVPLASGLIEGRVFNPNTGEYLEFGSPTRWVVSLDAKSGREVWSRDMGTVIFSEAFVEGGLVVLSSTEGKHTVLDAETGAPVKKKPPAAPAKPAPALECKQADGKLTCRDPKAGAENPARPSSP